MSPITCRLQRSKLVILPPTSWQVSQNSTKTHALESHQQSIFTAKTQPEPTELAGQPPTTLASTQTTTVKNSPALPAKTMPEQLLTAPMLLQQRNVSIVPAPARAPSMPKQLQLTSTPLRFQSQSPKYQSLELRSLLRVVSQLSPLNSLLISASSPTLHSAETTESSAISMATTPLI